MNEEKSLREEIADVKRIVNDIAEKLNDIEPYLKRLDERSEKHQDADGQPKN